MSARCGQGWIGRVSVDSGRRVEGQSHRTDSAAVGSGGHDPGGGIDTGLLEEPDPHSASAEGHEADAWRPNACALVGGADVQDAAVEDHPDVAADVRGALWTGRAAGGQGDATRRAEQSRRETPRALLHAV